MNIYQLTIWYADGSTETVLFSDCLAAKRYAEAASVEAATKYSCVSDYEIYAFSGDINQDGSLEMVCLGSGPLPPR
jgi:hypothetical protein